MDLPVRWSATNLFVCLFVIVGLWQNYDLHKISLSLSEKELEIVFSVCGYVPCWCIRSD